MGRGPGNFINPPSEPRSRVPLLLGSCVSSEIGLLICFLCKTLLSAVVTVWLVPDAAIWTLSEYALSKFCFTIFFVKKEGEITNSFRSFLLFHRQLVRDTASSVE